MDNLRNDVAHQIENCGLAGSIDALIHQINRAGWQGLDLRTGRRFGPTRRWHGKPDDVTQAPTRANTGQHYTSL